MNIAKDRTQLDKDMAEFYAKGGSVKVIPNDRDLSEKKARIRRLLFYVAHHKFHSKNTGISVDRLGVLRRNLDLATREEMETLDFYAAMRKAEVL